MTPLEAAEKYNVCMALGTLKGYMWAYAILENLSWFGGWPERAPDCLRSYRCKCPYCVTHRTVLKLLKGTPEEAQRRAALKIEQGSGKSASQIVWERAPHNRVSGGILLPDWLSQK